MFIKLTGYYSNVYVKVDEIRSFKRDRDGNTIIRFIRDDSEVVSVRETPDEVMQKINEMRGKNND